MNDSTEHPLHETTLHDALHAQVRGSGGDAAGAQLVGLADGALRIARRRQRLARAGVGIVAAAAVATAWVAVADDSPPRANVIRPAEGDSTENTGKAALLSVLPITSRTDDQACKQGSGGYTVDATANHPQFCVRTDRAKGMTDIRVTSAKAVRSSVDGTWVVVVTLDSTDRTRFAALTGSIAPAPAPRNGFAVVVDGRLWAMPYVSASITGGRLQIGGPYSGELTGATAHDLAARLDPR